MDISLLGLKLNVEILILIGVVYLIMVGHTICGCCNANGIMEGLANMNRKVIAKKDKKPVSHLASSMPVKNGKEGFVGANTNYGESSQYRIADYSPVDTSSWGLPTLAFHAGEPLPPAVKTFLDRPSQPIPLPEGEMSMFANTPFKPECCPNTYSNSSGCACMTSQQYNYIIQRGSNNIPYSEY